MIEIWKDVKGYEGMYQVSDSGRVKSLARTVERSDGTVRPVCEKILTCSISTDGYVQCKLCSDGQYKTVKVHRLVAEAFLPKAEDGFEVNHIDCDRRNNHVSNLEWMSHGDNVRYAISCGNHFCTRDITGKNNPNFGNHRLHYFYKENPEAIKKLVRRGGENGMAKPVRLVDYDLEFSYIGECAQWLVQNGFTQAAIRAVSNRIGLCAKSGKKYLGLNFELL